MRCSTGENEALARALVYYRGNFEAFARDCLKIPGKTPGLPPTPLVLNKAQRYFHSRVEAHRQRNGGLVRVLAMKGRQQGISTYVEARYYHRTTLWHGVNAYILASDQAASDNIFNMVDRYQRHNPLAPPLGADNAKELEFSGRDSRYTVAIAGQKASGRSFTTHLFHGSEVAFWTNPEAHFAASVETVPPLPGTEIILESTSGGPSGKFYEMWRDAERGESEYEAIFIPWYWQDEYVRPVPDDFELSSERLDGQPSEADLVEMYSLTPAQVMFRRWKIRSSSLGTFNREYPMDAATAFLSADTGSFIPLISIVAARRREVEPSGPLIVGVDPAGPGGDRFAICGRRGHAVEFLQYRNKVGTNEAVAWIKQIIDEKKPALVNIDAGGLGSAVISAVKDLGDAYRAVVRGVNFGAPSQSKMAVPKRPGPKNRRAEMWCRLKEWLELEEGVAIIDSDELQLDLVSARLKPLHNNDTLLESKSEMRRRGARSPDLGDALALTFASLKHIPVFSDAESATAKGETKPATSTDVPMRRTGPTGWMI